MKKTLTTVTLTLMATLYPLAHAASEDRKLTTPEEKTSYLLGRKIAAGLKQAPIPIDLPALTLAIEDILQGRQSRLPPQEEATTLRLLQDKIKASRQQRLETLGEKNRAAGTAFLAENGKKPDVKTTQSGLQFQVIKEGTGPQPKASDQVTVHYQGTLLDGTVFDSSIQRGQPAAFPLDKVIKGWSEGLQLMKVGSKYRFVIPFNLAYGATGAGENIDPYATLIFEVELLSIP